MVEVKKAVKICNEAAKLISGDREESHGSVRQNHENIAKLWNAYLVIRQEPAAELTAVDILHMMVLLKMARTQLGKYNPDDWLDGVGYLALAGEVTEEDERIN